MEIVNIIKENGIPNLVSKSNLEEKWMDLDLGVKKEVKKIHFMNNKFNNNLIKSNLKIIIIINNINKMPLTLNNLNLTNNTKIITMIITITNTLNNKI